MVRAARATIAGGRKGLLSARWPIHFPGTCRASAARSVNASNAGPPRSKEKSPRWSFSQADSKTSS